jgi:cobyrinic acid a,c-diamide synthase
MGKPVHRLELYDKINLKYMGFDIVDWIHLTQDRESVVGHCFHASKTSSSVEDVTSWLFESLLVS